MKFIYYCPKCNQGKKMKQINELKNKLAEIIDVSDDLIKLRLVENNIIIYLWAHIVEENILGTCAKIEISTD